MARMVFRRVGLMVGMAFMTLASALARVARKKVLTLGGAKTIVAAAEAEARRLGTSGVIAVVDDGGHLLMLVRLDHSFPAGSAVSIDKTRTAATVRRPSRDFEEAVQGGRPSLLAVSVMTPLRGGAPIVVDGQVVGAVGVSGAMSAQQDDDIARLAAAALG